MRLIIDTDAGIDDAVAIMLALRHPGVTVEAITTVCGNVSLEKVNANVLTILDEMGADVPVFAGADRPLVADWAAETVHGADGLGNYDQRKPSSRRLEAEHAALALIRLANAHPGELTLVALAPQTNIALATRLDPSFPTKIREFVFMGGTIGAQGNTANLAAEWNLYCDPEAAYIALHAFPLSRMVSWETTLLHPLPMERYHALAALPTDAGRFFEAINRVFMTPEYAAFSPGGYLLADALAMAVALEPALIREQMRRYVTIELGGTHARGQSIIDHWGRLGKAPNVDIVTKADMEIMERLLRETLSR